MGGRRRVKNTVTKKDEVSVTTKALTPNGGHDKDSFPELPTILYWARQVIGIIVGITWGIIPMQGLMGLASFGLINAGLLFWYFSKFLKVDEESYGGAWKLTTEGFMPSFGLFLLAWTIVFTAIHHPGDLNDFDEDM